jgi:hypothetical protein
MTDAVRHLLESFNTLSPEEQRVFISTLQSRLREELDVLPLEYEDLAFMGSEVFKMYENDEGKNA